MSQEQLVMQDAELEFDEELETREEEEVQEVAAEVEETISDELMAPEVNKVMDATQLYLGEIGFSPCSPPKKKSITLVVRCEATKPLASA